VFYFSVSAETSGQRIAAERSPSYYEAGQDVTGIDDPVESYRQFIDREIREYESLSLIFQFVKVDGEQAIYEQHRKLREIFACRKAQPWAERNHEALADWLRHNGMRGPE
jgi:hypothetical protein